MIATLYVVFIAFNLCIGGAILLPMLQVEVQANAMGGYGIMRALSLLLSLQQVHVCVEQEQHVEDLSIKDECGGFCPCMNRNQLIRLRSRRSRRKEQSVANDRQSVTKVVMV